jgi:hypothetical protein
MNVYEQKQCFSMLTFRLALGWTLGKKQGSHPVTSGTACGLLDQLLSVTSEDILSIASLVSTWVLS